MQHKTSQDFTQRLERLKFTCGWTDEQLASATSISRRMLWLMRNEKAEISAKSWWKLEAAEREAGLSPSSPPVRLAVEGASGAKEKDSICNARVELERALDQIEAGVRAMREALRRMNR